MAHMLWVAYGALLFSGLVYLVASSSERSLRRITFSQLIYVACLISATRHSVYVSSHLWIVVAAAALFTAAVVYEGLSDRERDFLLPLEQFQSDFATCQKALKEKPDSLLANQAIASVYERMGEPTLAGKHYERLSELCDAEDTSAAEKMRDVAEEKLARLKAMGPACAENPRYPFAFRACSLCSAPMRRDWYCCSQCGRECYDGRWTWRCALIGRVLEQNSLVAIALAAAAFLPFLFECGSTFYSMLLGVWSLIFVTTVAKPRALGIDTFKDLKPLLVHSTVMTCVLVGYAAHAVRAAGREQAYVASLSFSRPNPTLEQVIEDLRQGRQNIELQEALADAELTGKLDAVVSDGVTYREVLQESREGYVGRGWAKILAGVKRRSRLAKQKFQNAVHRGKAVPAKLPPVPAENSVLGAVSAPQNAGDVAEGRAAGSQ